MVDWRQRSAALAGCRLLVNTTSLGMTGQEPLKIDLARLPPDAVVADIVYSPLETELLAAARARGTAPWTVSACFCTKRCQASSAGLASAPK